MVGLGAPTSTRHPRTLLPRSGSRAADHDSPTIMPSRGCEGTRRSRSGAGPGTPCVTHAPRRGDTGP